MVSVHYDSVMF